MDCAPFTITDGRHFRLKRIKPSDTGGVDKKDALRMLGDGLEELRALQEQLYAQGRSALLVIFQAMDAAGKDSTIAHVMAGVDPQGCDVTSFKAPSTGELAHDFLWRTTCRLPMRGHIGIFNRSYYEEVLAVRVHPELLAPQRLPRELMSSRLWRERFDDINAFERHMLRSGTVVLKFFLHVSRDEQRKRLLERLDDPGKRWKFTPADVGEREHWDDYMDVYEDMIRHTATSGTPWHVVPADHKWFTRLVVADVIRASLRRLDLKLPKAAPAERREMAKARDILEREV